MLSDKKIKFIVIIPIIIIVTLTPLFIFYKWQNLIIKYLFLFGIPIWAFKIEIDRSRIKRKIIFVDFLTYFIYIITVIISIINIKFVEIFVWQISLGFFGIIFGLFFDLDLQKNKFVNRWNRIAFVSVFFFFLLKNLHLLI
jgi:hypothetical protein